MTCNVCTSLPKHIVKSLGGNDAYQVPVRFQGAVFKYGEVVNLLSQQGITLKNLNQFIKKEDLLSDVAIIKQQIKWHMKAESDGTTIVLREKRIINEKETFVFACGDDPAAFLVYYEDGEPKASYRISVEHPYHQIENFIRPVGQDITRCLLWNMTNDIIKQSIKNTPRNKKIE